MAPEVWSEASSLRSLRSSVNNCSGFDQEQFATEGRKGSEEPDVNTNPTRARRVCACATLKGPSQIHQNS